MTKSSADLHLQRFLPTTVPAENGGGGGRIAHIWIDFADTYPWGRVLRRFGIEI